MKLTKLIIVLPLLALGACGNHANNNNAGSMTDTFKTDTANYTNGPDNAAPQASDSTQIMNNQPADTSRNRNNGM